jgi:hypothetical protein
MGGPWEVEEVNEVKEVKDRKWVTAFTNGWMVVPQPLNPLSPLLP